MKGRKVILRVINTFNILINSVFPLCGAGFSDYLHLLPIPGSKAAAPRDFKNPLHNNRKGRLIPLGRRNMKESVHTICQ